MERPHPAITMSVLGALCAFGLILGIRGLTAPLPDDDLVSDAPATCENRQIEAGTVIARDEVTVSVYNAGGKSGMASKTMQALIERGFAAGKSGNIEADDVQRVQVWADDAANPAAKLVAQQFGKGVKIITGKQLEGIGIMVVIGPNLGDLPKTTPDRITASVAATICSPPVL